MVINKFIQLDRTRIGSADVGRRTKDEGHRFGGNSNSNNTLTPHTQDNNNNIINNNINNNYNNNNIVHLSLTNCVR